MGITGIVNAGSFQDFKEFEKIVKPNISELSTLIIENENSFSIQPQSNGKGLIIHSGSVISWQDLYEKIKAGEYQLLIAPPVKVQC